MYKACIILTNIDNKELAYRISKELIQSRLAACVNIDEITSLFEWKDEIRERKEFRLMIKAKDENYKKIESKILSLHNDTVPEIIKIDIAEGLDSYLNWINKI